MGRWVGEMAGVLVLGLMEAVEGGMCGSPGRLSR